MHAWRCISHTSKNHARMELKASSMYVYQSSSSRKKKLIKTRQQKKCIWQIRKENERERRRDQDSRQQLGPLCATMERLDVFVPRHEEAHWEPIETDLIWQCEKPYRSIASFKTKTQKDPKRGRERERNYYCWKLKKLALKRQPTKEHAPDGCSSASRRDRYDFQRICAMIFFQFHVQACHLSR